VQQQPQAPPTVSKSNIKEEPKQKLKFKQASPRKIEKISKPKSQEKKLFKSPAKSPTVSTKNIAKCIHRRPLPIECARFASLTQRLCFASRTPKSGSKADAKKKGCHCNKSKCLKLCVQHAPDFRFAPELTTAPAKGTASALRPATCARPIALATSATITWTLKVRPSHLRSPQTPPCHSSRPRGRRGPGHALEAAGEKPNGVCLGRCHHGEPAHGATPTPIPPPSPRSPRAAAEA
jgi:hypothetical protein